MLWWISLFWLTVWIWDNSVQKRHLNNDGVIKCLKMIWSEYIQHNLNVRIMFSLVYLLLVLILFLFSLVSVSFVTVVSIIVTCFSFSSLVFFCVFTPASVQFFVGSRVVSVLYSLWIFSVFIKRISPGLSASCIWWTQPSMWHSWQYYVLVNYSYLIDS